MNDVTIIDRFLEHSRIFYFENGGDPEIFCSSADSSIIATQSAICMYKRRNTAHVALGAEYIILFASA